MNNSEPDLEECVPIKTDVTRNLAAEEVYDLLVYMPVGSTKIR